MKMRGYDDAALSDSSLSSPLPLSFAAKGQEWIPDLQPRPDGVCFIRGVFLAIALCVPIWMLGWWAVASHL
jgi:hypothetical protein